MLWALLVTILLEGVVMYVLTHSVIMVKYNLYCNLITNPLLNFALLGTGALFRFVDNPLEKALLSYYIPLVFLEAVVFWGESRLYILMTDYGRKECVRLSVITNLVSAAAGLVVSFFYYF